MSNDGERAADEHDERADGLRHDAGMCGACGTEFVMTAEMLAAELRAAHARGREKGLAERVANEPRLALEEAAHAAGFDRGAESILYRLAAASAEGEARGLERAEKAIVQCAPQWHPPSWFASIIRALALTPAAPVRSYEDGVRDGLEMAERAAESEGRAFLTADEIRALKAVPRG